MCETCQGKSKHKTKKPHGFDKGKEQCSRKDERKQELLKCPKPRRRLLEPKKCLTRTEKIMLLIQPPIADRDRYLHPEHVNCFLEESHRVYIKKPECVPCPPERKPTCMEGKRSTKKVNGNAEAEKNQSMEDGKEGVKSGAEEGGEEEKIDLNKDKENTEKLNLKRPAKKSKKRKNKANRKPKEDTTKDTDSELSICSNDSEICLVGSRLTAKDKERIEENRRRVHPPSADKADHGAENAQEAQKETSQESEDKTSKPPE